MNPINRETKMSNISIANAAISGLILGSAVFGALPIGQDLTGAHAAAPTQTKQAEARLAKSVKASMLKGKMDRALASAEQLVALAPQNAGWRQLLGETYLSAGRFQSAATSFNDALTLNPASSVSALKMALALTAIGDVNTARSLLETHKSTLSPADYGLAVALAGDAPTAVQTLEAAVRAGWNDARTRQNLALSYALTGRWVEARVTAAQDVAPDQLDQRMTEWATLSRPRAAWDQVAGVLGVKARLDRGQPAQLALNVAVQQPVQVAAVEAPIAQQEAYQEPVQVAMAEPVAGVPAPIAAEPYVAPRQQIVMAPRREVVQPIPQTAYRESAAAPMIKADRRPAKQQVRVANNKPAGRLAAAVANAPAEAAARDRFIKEAPDRQSAPQLAQPRSTASQANGKTFKSAQFAVQLGAFGDQASAKSVWGKVAAKVPELAKHKPMTSRANVKGKSITRLASAGFASRDSAESACSKVRAAGQDCFIRTVPAQELAQWVALDGRPGHAPVKLAQRKDAAPAKPAKISAARPKAPVRPDVKIALR
jgi:Flp pilus assembly protein TadD